MKTFKTKLLSAIIAFGLCAGVILLPGCHSDDDDDIDAGDSCQQLTCLNGGNAIKDVEFDTCRCICPTGYSGANCEIKNP